MATQEQKKLAIENLKKEHGLNLLALYEMGSTLHGLDLETSDYDLLGILKTQKRDLLKGTQHSSQTISEDGILDVRLFDEYKLLNMIRKNSVKIISVFLKDPVYLSDEWAPAANYIKDNFLEILFSNPVSAIGGLFGEYRSFTKKYDDNEFFVGAPFAPKPLLGAILVRTLARELVKMESTDETTFEKIKEAIIPSERASLLFKSIRSMTELKNESDVAIFSEEQRRLHAYLEEIEEIKGAVAEYVTWGGTNEHNEALIELLLPPV